MKNIALLFLFLGCLNNTCSSQAVFLSLQTQTHNDTIDVNWITQTETNVDYFILQRAYIGNAVFSDIDTINAVGNSSVNQYYTYNDIPPLVDTCYLYRLKDVETNGQFAFTSIVPGCVFMPTAVAQFKNESETVIYPNPFREIINVVTTENQSLEILLYDITSRKILQQKFTNTVTLNTSQLSKGIYIYEVRNKNGVVKKGKVVRE